MQPLRFENAEVCLVSNAEVCLVSKVDVRTGVSRHPLYLQLWTFGSCSTGGVCGRLFQVAVPLPEGSSGRSSQSDGPVGRSQATAEGRVMAKPEIKNGVGKSTTIRPSFTGDRYGSILLKKPVCRHCKIF